MTMMRLISFSLLVLFTLFWLSVHISGQASAQSGAACWKQAQDLADRIKKSDDNGFDALKNEANQLKQTCLDGSSRQLLDGSISQRKNLSDANNRASSFANAPN
jgi:hypothetical protein